jgi:hypothetical protein
MNYVKKEKNGWWILEQLFGYISWEIIL